jgi:hypothetical protein
VLPRIYWNAQRALFDKAATRLRDGANKASKPMPPIANIAESSCAAGIFVIRAMYDRYAFDVVATHRWRPKALCADSESRFLAIKKFSCPPASRLIGARQNRIFARIAAPLIREAHGFRFAPCADKHGE